MQIRLKHAFFAFFAVSAAQSQQPLSLAEAVERALRAHPLLEGAGARIAASEGLRLQAGLRPNPRFTLQGENFRPYGGDRFEPSREIDTFAFVTQSFELGHKRGRRVEAASTEVRRGELERELLRKQIAGRVRQSYWAAAGAQKIHELLLETVGNFQNIVQYHETRVREGAMAEADLLKVRIEGERLAIGANTALLEAERARIQLLREMGQNDFSPVRLTQPIEGDLAMPVVNVDGALAQRTEVKLARQLRETAEANLRLQQANARPDLDVSFGYKRTSGFSSMLAGANVALPFNDRNQGNIAAARAQVRVAESEVAAAAALVRAEVRTAELNAQTRRRQITDMLRGLVERASESSRIAQAAYREGGSGLLQLLDAERVRIELEGLYYRTLAEYRQSLVELEMAMGVEP
jgi:cobalt-zinc-cadmium efflux system outer membrane protein